MFINISFNLAISISLVSMFVFAILYFIIFRKYNKRNKLNIFEIIRNMLEYSSKSALHMFTIALGLDYFIEGMLLLESVYERYANFFVAVLILSITIFHYIKYVKKLFIDLKEEDVKANEKRTEKFAEYVMFIFLGAMLITPVFYIPRAAAISVDGSMFFTELIKALGCSLTGGYLLVYMNPLGVVRKKDEKTIFDQTEEDFKTDDVEENAEKVEVSEVENIEENKEAKETKTKKTTKSNTSKKSNNKTKTGNNSKKKNSKKGNSNTKSKKK